MKKIVLPLLFIGLIVIVSVIWNQSVKQKGASQQAELAKPETNTANNPQEAAEVSTSCSGKALPELTEGPYYTAGSPQRQTISETNTPTIPLTLEGYVYDTDCKPIANAWIDFWQASGEGEYDNTGYLLRGHQYTDANGKYKLVTVVPGQYPGRTEHIHFKIRTSDASQTVTSQLFIPSSTNENDSIFDESLVIDMKNARDGQEKTATYNFVVNR